MTNQTHRLSPTIPARDVLHLCFVAPNAYHVLMDSDSGYCGGAEVQQYLLAKALVEKGHRVTIVVQDLGGTPICEVRHGIEIVKGPFRYLGGSNAYFLVDSLNLVCLLRKINADFYLLKCPRALLFAMSIHRRVFGKRLVKWVANESDCDPQGWSPSCWLYRLGAKAADCFVFQSDSQKALAEKKLGIQGTVVPSIAHAHDETEECRSKDIDVLWVGSCTRNKQPEVVLDLASSTPDIQYSIIMSQGSCPLYNREIEERAKSLRNVKYEGFVPYTRIPQFYGRAKLLLCTSKREGFPNTFLQAWQEGVPVVSLAVDPDHVIMKYQLGKVSGDVEHLRCDLRSLVRDNGLREPLAANGREYVRKYHSPDRVVNQLMGVLKSVY